MRFDHDPPHLPAMSDATRVERLATRTRSERKRAWYELASRLFAREAVKEAVATRVRFHASPETIWHHLMFYEDVPRRPALLLRTVLPSPVRTEGDKTCLGATVRCAYNEGDVTKRITRVERARLLQFEVVEQRLGIEGCVRTLGGSYEIHRCGDASELLMTTNYHAYLRPRFFWRLVEAFLVGQLHRHILGGISAALPVDRSCARLLRNP